MRPYKHVFPDFFFVQIFPNRFLLGFFWWHMYVCLLACCNQASRRIPWSYIHNNRPRSTDLDTLLDDSGRHVIWNITQIFHDNQIWNKCTEIRQNDIDHSIRSKVPRYPIYVVLMSETQISLSPLRSTISHFRNTGHFETTALNDSKITSNTTRSKQGPYTV